ncbi:MAG TPA: glycosyltransferase [Candidatus Angelobacter sp.]|nr:glycosyltransferase [Candidatus Angelobacter sp.]
MRILYIGYPLLTVSEESAGGAEQILWALEREMHARGAYTMVAASSGSSVSGELFSTGQPCRETDDFDRRSREHQERVLQLIHAHECTAESFDLVHDMSGGFWPRAAEINAPVLATLHLPRLFYDQRLFRDVPLNVRFNCVSASQARSFADLQAAETVVPNGILLERFAGNANQPREGLFWLGRICPEKAPHIALDIAQRARMPITLAGEVYPFSYHQQYFSDQVLPRLRQMPDAIFISKPSPALKRRLLAEAQAMLITSQAEETSSLVAMEAAASGTPVVAFRRGALPEIVKDGVTGFLADSFEEAVLLLSRIGDIRSEECRRHAARFSSDKMAQSYDSLYEQVMASVLV